MTWAVPILADRVAAFSDDSEFSLSTTHGKILVAQRGSVPIAVKALNLQVRYVCRQWCFSSS